MESQRGWTRLEIEADNPSDLHRLFPSCMIVIVSNAGADVTQSVGIAPSRESGV
jgi:hypothetical protein